MSTHHLASILLFWLFLVPVAAWGQTVTTLWPTVLFIRGQDLCQYQDAYGKRRSEQALDMTGQLMDLFTVGVESHDGLDILRGIDGLIDKNRALVAAGNGMDVTLEASLKANIDALYRSIGPRETKLKFLNTSPLLDLLRELRERKRQYSPNFQQLSKLSGFVWGTYSFGPDCRGDILVTTHVETSDGNSVSFQAQGRPQDVMASIASRMFSQFQRTRFPSVVGAGPTALHLVGAPGTPVDKAPSPESAQKVCASIKARLPTRNEYELLSSLGDWNGGVSLGHWVWALADGHLLAPDLQNPSPVRHPEEVNAEYVFFYCVR